MQNHLAPRRRPPSAPQPQVVLSDEKELTKKEEPEFKEFKPGDKIPLDELKQRDPSLADSWRRHEKSNNGSVNAKP